MSERMAGSGPLLPQGEADEMPSIVANVGKVTQRIGALREIVRSYEGGQKVQQRHRTNVRAIAGEIKGSTFPRIAKVLKGRALTAAERARQEQLSALHEHRESYNAARAELDALRGQLTGMLTQAIKDRPHLGLVLNNRQPLSEPGSTGRAVAFLAAGEPTSITADELIRLTTTRDFEYGHANSARHSGKGLGVHKYWPNIYAIDDEFARAGYRRAVLTFKREENIPNLGATVPIPQIVEAILDGRFM